MFVSKKTHMDRMLLSMNYMANVADDLWEETDDLWEALSELSALVEFLVKKQEKAQKPAKAVKTASTGRTTKK